MIAIGTHGQAGIIRLQARAIRANCGDDMPILVSDDRTEEAFDPARGQTPERGREIKDRLLAICREEGLIYRDTAPGRVGHAGGDLGALYHGISHARDHGLPFVCKLSQRFVLDIPNWFRTVTDLMDKFRMHTCSRHCFYGGSTRFHLRTEFLVVRVADWSQPRVLGALVPRPLGYAAEDLIDRCRGWIGGNFLACPLFGQDRHADYPGIAWHDTLPGDVAEENYRRLAAKYGVDLGPEFSVAHSCTLPGHVGG